MTEAHALPAPIVPYDWGGVDTSVDDETPELLSEDQLDRYVETVAELLRSAGLDVDTGRDDPTHLSVRRSGGRFTLDLYIRDDRSTEWAIEGGDEVSEGTTAVRLASFLVPLMTVDADR
ncbi:hypothetical protein BJF83_01950 [Nocardiopsis sp. CNR-923]|uniref:hypothetical protein n=1 Tax=Nocardiopsis sp. CNR-923 TaxID=1904965 RepID=UPI00095EDA51|nr:hypothetical protein [Nocardiopsis sp. CNR-923]OLT27368.1 hypothetical protein BJF83_01950 [Nocardiopsis sp. CNR-923]